MRINTPLQVSHMKSGVEALLLLIVVLILLCSDLPVLMIAWVFTAMVGVMIYQKWFQKAATHLVHLVQFDQQAWRWSVCDPHRTRKSFVQEGRLLRVHHWFFVLVMRFETTKKHKTVQQSWVIWRDQVDADHWRRLMVIARFWARDVPDAKD